MKRSDRIIKANGVQEGLSWQRQETLKNGILLRHIIDNDMNHIWWWIRIIVVMILGLYAKSFIGG